MNTDKFFTEVKIDKSILQLTHNDNILLIGSCFTDEIGNKFTQAGFNVLKNPFGTIYNPVSIANLIIKAINNEYFTSDDVIKSDEYYYLFATHGDIRGKSAEECINNGNKIIYDVNKYLNQTTVIIITPGTAWSYWYKEGNVLMGNCHKIPQKLIERRLLTINEIEMAFNNVISAIKSKTNDKIKFIFTISPVRHVKEGLHADRLSKSTLLLATENIVSQNENAYYFPSYEIIIDELRDYRFYSKDLIHVNEVGVDYIWHKFSDTYFSDKTKELNEKFIKLFQMKNHRPFNPNSEGYQKHLLKVRQLEHDLYANKHDE